jgi:dTDP-4-dehydrorhamnose 3,5-epimerase
MKVTPLKIPGVKLIEPDVFEDERGFFYESFNQQKFNKAIGENITFVQDNHSYSKKNVLRGLHMQKSPNTQGKLVRVIKGEVLDVAVDMRPKSETFGNYIREVLSEKNKKQLWIPEGFAHGFLARSNDVEFLYKTTNFYCKDDEITIKWNDKKINIDWGLEEQKIIINSKDQNGISFDSYYDLFD